MFVVSGAIAPETMNIYSILAAIWVNSAWGYPSLPAALSCRFQMLG